MTLPSLAQFKQVLRRQGFLMLLDAGCAVKALPAVLPAAGQRREALAAARQAAGTRGTLSDARQVRFAELETLLAIPPAAASWPASAVRHATNQAPKKARR